MHTHTIEMQVPHPGYIFSFGPATRHPVTVRCGAVGNGRAGPDDGSRPFALDHPVDPDEQDLDRDSKHAAMLKSFGALGIFSVAPGFPVAKGASCRFMKQEGGGKRPMWQFGLVVLAFVTAVGLVMWWLRAPPLHEAVEQGDFSRVKTLVDGGADVNQVAFAPGKNSDGRTPLHLAARHRSVDIVEYLMEKGAEVNAATPRMFDTPLHYAAGSKWREATTIAELLVAKGAAVDARNHDGYTPLHVAAEDGLRETVEFFLRSGGDLRSRSVIGLTPLHCAARGDNKEAAALLVSKGADLNALDKEGRTPLVLAAASNSNETAEYFKAAARARKGGTQ